MLYEVSLTKDAERDQEEIYVYIADHVSRASADHALDRLAKAAIGRLTTLRRMVPVCFAY